MSILNRFLLGFFLLGFIVPVFSQESITKANFKQAANWSVPKQLERIKFIWTNPLWLDSSDSFIYKYGSRDAISYYIADAANGKKRELFDHRKLTNNLEKLADTSLDWRNLNIHIKNSTLVPKKITFQFDGQVYRYWIDLDSLIESSTSVASSDETVYSSPNGKYAIISGSDGIRFVETEKKEKPMKLPLKKLEGYNMVPGTAKWSPDSRFVAATFEDWTHIQDLWLIDHYSDPRPTLRTFKWPLPNEITEKHRLCIYDTRRKKMIVAEAERWADESYGDLSWSPDSKVLYFQRMSRDWKSLDLCAADPFTGKCRVLLEEHKKRQPIGRPPYNVIPSTGEIIWWSWRNGYGQYYLYTSDGTLKRPLTHATYHAGEVIRIDNSTRILYFMGNGGNPVQNPYLHQLYAASLDTTSVKLLTPEEAEHHVFFSPSGKFFVDNYSRADVPPHTVVRDVSGTRMMELETADISWLEDAGWKPPEIFCVKAGDGQTDLWGVLFKPYDFDSTKQYPVITYGYPGKEGEALPLKFYGNYWVTLVSTSLAQYGFIVVVSGTRGGSWERGYDYYNFGEKNLRDYPVEDKKTAIEQLAIRHPFMDTSRVGIMGSSSGGLLAATSILLEPEFFKVAVSKSGNHDNQLFYHIWNERYGIVKEVSDTLGKTRFLSKSRTNNQLADNLKGKLLLVVGDMDPVVPPSTSYRLAYDLMMANKRFDLFLIPNAGHFWGDNYPYVIKTIENYFVEFLMGDKSHEWEIDLFQSSREKDEALNPLNGL